MVHATKKAKLRWQCRRGMLELDLILNHFLEKQLDSMTDQQITAFERLLECIDPELYNWLMGYSRPEDKELADIVTYIQFHTQI